jgi:hypothetical protein
MGWLSKLLGSVPKEELDGLRMEIDGPFWDVDGPKTFTEILTALDGWLPDNSILYFEGGSPDKEINQFMAAKAISEQTHIAFGTIWPRPRVYHVPANHDTLRLLTTIMERHAEPELAIHFHVYRQGKMIIEWHDAFSQPMLIKGEMPEEQIKEFTRRLGTEYRRGRTRGSSLS